MAETPNKQPSEIVFHQIGLLTNKTIEFNTKIKESKTRTKIDFYRRKMIRNNKKIEMLLPLAEKLRVSEEAARVKAAAEAVVEA
jgi:hypothetical protein